MAEAGSDLVTAFTIRELTGQKRTLTLRERALPYRPFELSGTQRNTVDWYPGSPIGTVQVFGAKEEQTTITGMWKDAFLLPRDAAGSGKPPTAEMELFTSEAVGGEEVFAPSSSALLSTRALVKAADSIRRSGQEIEVTWLDQVRRGILERFTAKWHTGHDAEWEMMFTWSSQGESFSEVSMRDDLATNLGDLPNKVVGELETIFNDLGDLVNDASATSADLLNIYGSVSAGLADLSDQLTDAVVAIGGVLQTPAEAMRRCAGILDGIKLDAVTLGEIIGELADGAALDSASDVLFGSLQRNFGDVLSVRGRQRDKAKACARLAALAASEQEALISQITSTVISTFQARDGQDLREVAMDAYGDPDAWRGLMVYNRLTTSQLRAGQVVFVPAQPPDGGC